MKSMVFVFFHLFSWAYAVTSTEAYDLASAGKAMIVDVREFDEISHGMIKDALWFPKSKMSQDPESVVAFKGLVSGKKVFLYCQKGKRAAECTKILHDYGIEAESIGGYDQLKKILPTEGLHQKLLRLRQSASSELGGVNK